MGSDASVLNSDKKQSRKPDLFLELLTHFKHPAWLVISDDGATESGGHGASTQLFFPYYWLHNLLKWIDF